jgi:hypothetical protein
MRSLLVIAVCASLCLFSGVSYPQPPDEICCTWTNAKYEASERPQKVIFNYDGTFADLPFQRFKRSKHARGVFQIDAKWKDPQGGIWYKLKMMDMYGPNYTLLRITKEGDSLEFVGEAYTDTPETISREASSYSQLYAYGSEQKKLANI